MKVLITGGYGLLGQYTADRLAGAGHQLVLTSRRPRAETRPGVEVRKLDLTHEGDLDHLPDVSAVVHAAALVPDASPESLDFTRLLRTNAEGTLRLLAWARAMRVRTFVYCSSMSVYAPDVTLPAKEDSRVYPAGKACLYGLSKLAGEVLAESVGQDSEGNFISLRFSTIYGKGMRRGEVVPAFIARARARETLRVAPGASGDFLYAKDAACAIEAALNSKARGVFNIGSGQETTILDLAQTVCQVVGIPTGSGIQMEPERAGRRFWMDISRAREYMGFRPTYSVREGLCDWLASESL